MPELPALFLQRMQALLGDEFSAFLEQYNQPPSTGLRVNTLKLHPGSFEAISPFTLQKVSWCPEGFFVIADQQIGESSPGKHPFYKAGLYYLQDPAAMAAVALLDPQPGERVLDLAAAPGGKSTHIAARLQGDGLLVANEIHPRRAWDLAENLERFGARNVVITQETPESLAEHFGAFFDRVLLDAPCSGEGMFRKSEAARQEWSLELVRGCALRQANIIDQAARLVRPGGTLAYVTCTFAPEEDEALLAAFLERQWQQHGVHFELVAVPPDPAFAPGRPDWLAGIYPAGPPERFNLHQAVRLWPQRGAGEGHFIALLRRFAGEDTGFHDIGQRIDPHYHIPKDVLQAYREFCHQHLVDWSEQPSSEEALVLVGQYLYQLPASFPAGLLEPSRLKRDKDVAGLRFIHPGWWFGEFKKGRFTPAHALAMGLQANQVSQILRLNPGSKELLAYLSGEELLAAGLDGWVLVCLETVAGAFPLGWGRGAQGRLKNHYPRGLRQHR